MPLELFIGEAAVCNFSEKKALEPVSSQDFDKAGVKEGDIVLAYGPKLRVEEMPYLSDEAVKWLINRKVKMVGIQNLHFSHPSRPFGITDNDAKLLLAGIALTDGLTNLDQIKKPRVFYIALPVKIRRLTAFWTRAIALEEV